MVLLQGTEFDLFIPQPLLDSADTWNAAKGKPNHYPKGRSKGTIGSPDDPTFKMIPGTAERVASIGTAVGLAVGGFFVGWLLGRKG